MAEYRKIVCPYGDDFEGGDECDRCDQYEMCLETPPADVVDHSKVVIKLKAMRKEIEQIKDVVHDGNNHYYKDCMETKSEVLKIIDKYLDEI
jgi:hypothetical protein